MNKKEMSPLPQSGVLPYRFGKGRFEVLLITNSSGTKWIIPKGQLEPDMTPQESALQEAKEEAGVKGVITGGVIGTYRSRKKKTGRLCVIDIYPMQVEKEMKKWHEKGMRKRRWCSVEEALEKVSNPELKEVIRSASEILNTK